MIKYYIKKSWAIILIITGIMFFMFGESLVDKNYILHNNYWLERLVVASVLILLGSNYLMIVEGRMEKYGRC